MLPVQVRTGSNLTSLLEPHRLRSPSRRTKLLHVRVWEGGREGGREGGSMCLSLGKECIKVTMTPFSLTACWIWVFDDSVYEGPEDLTVRLGTNSTWVVLSRARAKVIITDEEDGKVMSELNVSYFDTAIFQSVQVCTDVCAYDTP